jgi:hypothetical protein
MTAVATPAEVSCAVEVFLAAALLHKEQPGRPGFTIQEIVRRAERENIYGELRPGVSVHASQHCVANKAPNPGRHKMLYATGKHTRRLLLRDDVVHPDRTGKIFPEPEEIPERYLPLLQWTHKRYTEIIPMRGNQQMVPPPLPPMSDEVPLHRQPFTDFPGHLEPGRQMVPPPGHVPSDNVQGRSPLYELLEARGIGAEMAKGIDPDDYIRELREGWE